MDTLDVGAPVVYDELAYVVGSVVGLEGIQCDSGAAPQRYGKRNPRLKHWLRKQSGSRGK
jgi:hypothetical protein